MMASKNTAVVAFVPVIHKGYVDFFSANDGDIFILSDELIKQFTFLTRDLRVMGEKMTVEALQKLFPDRNIKPVRSFDRWSYDLTIMPEDEVSHEIAEKYLSGKKVEFKTIFLRWNRVITFKEHEIDPKRKISKANLDKEFMEIASKEKNKSADWWRQVSAVAVRDGKVLLKAHNHHMPSDYHLSTNGDPRSNVNAGENIDLCTAIHAEADLIAQAAALGISLDGSNMYVTTFPCPVCARLIARAGVKKVFYSHGYSLLDAEKILDHFGIDVVLVQD